MSLRTISAAALSLVASGLVFAQALQWSHSARFGPLVQNAGRCALSIVAVDASGRSSGLRIGDTIDLPRMTPQARGDVAYHYALLHAVPLGTTISLAVERSGVVLDIPYRFVHDEGPLVFVAQLAFKLLILSIGLFVLWRGRDRAANWLGLWCTGIAVALPDGWWGGASDGVRTFGTLLNNAVWTCLPFALYMVVESIVPVARRSLVWTARIALVLTLLPQLVLNVIDATAQTMRGCAISGFDARVASALFVGSQLIVLGYFIAGYYGTKGLERVRMRWVFWAFVLSRIGVLLNLVNRLSTHPLQLSGVEWLTIVIFPLGCAYAILRHRLIDVNFVLNRTLIYTILTTFVVGVFVLLEHILNTVAVGRGVGFVMEVVVALALGLSFNAMHKRVEQMLDRTLFRAKHEATKSLELLSEEAAYIENPEALLERATTEIPRAVGGRGAAIYERRGDGYHLIANTGIVGLPEIVDTDDPAFVRLRKRLSQVDLGDVQSALGSDAVAFAFAVRGQLTGAFLCGRRVNGETYAPDEIAAVRSAVHEVGAELSAMRSRERAELLSGLLSGTIDLRAARAQHS